MKLTIARDSLSPALAALSRVVERKNTIPILSNLLLRAADGALRIKATDLDIEATTTLACEVETEGALTVPAHTFADIVRKLPGGVQVTLQAENDTRATLRAGRSRFVMNTLPESDFPDITAGEMTHRFALEAKLLAGLIAQTAFAISSEETRYYLNGIFLHAVDGEGGPRLRAVSTDGHRLARFELPAPAGTADMPNVIVPTKTVNELARLAKETQGEIAIEVSASKIRVTAGATTLTSKLIDGTYPDYQRVIPAGNDRLARLDREAFQQAIDRVAAISSERGRAVKLSLSEGTLALAVTNPDSGEAREEIEADYDGAPIEIGFNSRYLLDVLGVLAGDQAVLKLADPGSPAILQSEDGAALLIVLMPMRV